MLSRYSFFYAPMVQKSALKVKKLKNNEIYNSFPEGKMSVKVLRTNDTWYGMTYHEDVATVKNSFKEMLGNGVYNTDLFSDL